MADLEGFDANNVEPQGEFELIPDGWLEAMIVESERKAANSGNGDYLALVFQVLDSRFPNRKLFHNLNLWNSNEQAKQISRGNLSAICRAVGVLSPKDSSALHNLPMLVKVGTKKGQDDVVRNILKDWKSKSGETKKQEAPAATAAKPVQGTAPWAKKTG